MSQLSAAVANTRWEQAYERFETPEQEVAKFLKRLVSIGADRWDRRSRILEVCSGRGSGLRAWHALGFSDVLGVDLSAQLVSKHVGPGRCVVGDARSLPLATASREVAVVQGGLHHLFTLADVDQSLLEMRRVVSPTGRIVIVEPWLTPFLRMVHTLTAVPWLRRCWPRLEALAIMIEEERSTYEQWLRSPDDCFKVISRHVAPEIVRRQWGKLVVVGPPRPQTNQVL